MSTPTVAIVGNPNSGKTTLFNALTGSTQKVGNWAGVTVERKDGYFVINDQKVKVVDLPGIYALAATSEDEKIALEYVLSGEADLVLNIVDATNLERNLYLTFQLAEMKVPLVVIVNMIDIAEGRGIKINLDLLSEKLGCPVYGISAIKKEDTQRVKEGILEDLQKKTLSSVDVVYPMVIQEWLNGKEKCYRRTAEQLKVSPRWIALRVLEKTSYITDIAKTNCEIDEKRIDEELSLPGSIDKPEILIAESRYRFISDLTKNVTSNPTDKINFSDRVDKVVLNRILGIPIFLAMMYLVFWATLTIGGAFIDFFDIAFGAIFVDGFAVVLDKIGTPSWITSILAYGVGAGIQTVSTFVPIVFMMFLCLSIMEDSGYMARAAFVMDRFMSAIGLPGKSFVPMLVGLGCTVPAVMATRTLESKRDRILTVFMTPFMSCGARLPVYALFGAVFFGASAGLMVFSLYLAGALLAILTGLLLKNTMFKGEPSYFIMELPPYHAPRPFTILRATMNRVKVFIVRAGKVIVIAVAFLGFMNSFGVDGTFGNEGKDNSVLAVIGSAITPVFEPMGVEEDNWPASVALFTGLFAKEAVVGTLNSLYSQMNEEEGLEEEEEEFNLKESLMEALATIPANLSESLGGFKDPLNTGIIGDEEAILEEGGADATIFKTMQEYFTQGKIQIYAYLLFILLYIPCMAAVGTIAREIGGKLTLILSVYLTSLGWITATLVYQIGVAHQVVWIVIPIVMLIAIGVSLRMLGKSDFIVQTK